MTPQGKDLVVKVLRQSGKPQAASDVQTKFEENGTDVSQYIDQRSSITAEIQRTLESMPAGQVDKLILGGRTKFQWRYQSAPSGNSLAARLS